MAKKRRRKPLSASQRKQFEAFLASKGKSLKRKKRRTKRAVSLRIVKRRKRKIQRVRRNPVGRFVICATLENGKHFYFRKSTESFVAGLAAATRYKSVAVAMRTAKLLLKQLPREIVSIKVDAVKK
jgi:hypothetical protein